MQGITFGSPYFETELGRIEPESEVHFGLLLYVSAGDPVTGVPRDELSETLWPDSPLELARHSLRQAMYRLRQLGVPIHLRGGQVILEENDTEIDLRDLTHGPVARDDLLRIATQPFLPGYSARLGSRFAGWVDDLRDRTDRVRRRALVEAVREARAQARFRDIHKLARALLALDPLNETATLALAEALVMDGSKVEALQMLDEYEREVGSVSEALRVPVRTLRRRVSECLDDALLPRRFEVPFVGREAEFKELREAFVATRQGQGQCVVITGEPGIGKTRIASELLRLAVLDGAMAVTYSCTSGDALTPLSSLLTLTQSLLGQPGALGCASEHLQYLRRLHSPEPAPVSIAGGMAADIAYAQLVYSLAELTAAITDEGPLVVFVDDAHRLHQTSWRIFTDVVDRLPEERVLLVFAARQLPEWYATLGINGSDGRSRHVRLLPFGAKESLSFLDSWADKNGVRLSDSTLSSFSQAAQGNPFYLSELAGHVGRGGTVGEAPASIRGLVELQYACMNKTAQRLLITVGLLQAHASMERVASILDVAPMEFVTALDELELAGLVAAAGPQIRVKHDLVIDVVFGLVSPGVTSFLRSRVAHTLEVEAEATHSIELLSDALTHWERGQVEERAYSTSLLLGSRLLDLGLSLDAHSAYERATKHAKSPADRAVAIGKQVEAKAAANSWGAICRLSPEVGEELEHHLSQASFDMVAFARAEARMWVNGELPTPGLLESRFVDDNRDVNLRLTAAILALIIADNNLAAQPFLALHRATLRALGNDTRGALDKRTLLSLLISVCEQRREDTLDLATRYSSLTDRLAPGERVRSVRHSAHAMLRIGQPAESRALFQRSLSLAEGLKLPHHQATCLDYLFRIALQMGDLDAATNHADTLQELALQLDENDLGRTWAWLNQVDLAWLRADVPVALALLPTLAHVSADQALQLNKHAVFMARAALSFASPGLLDGPTLTWCRSLDHQVLSRGCADLTTVIAAKALLIAGERREAAALLGDYLKTYRIEKTPLPYLLWSALPPGLVPTSVMESGLLDGANWTNHTTPQP